MINAHCAHSRFPRSRGDLDGALALYEEGLKIARALMAELGTPQSRSDVSFSLNSVASIEQARGDLDGALARYEEGLEIRLALMAELGTPESRRDVSVMLYRVAEIEQARGDLDGALARYEERLVIARRLLEDEETPERLRHLGSALHKIGKLEQSRGNPDVALEKLCEVAVSINRLEKFDDLRLDDVPWYLQVTCDAAEIEIHRTDYQGAILRLDSELECAEAIETASLLQHLGVAATYWERRAEALDALGRSAESTESRTRALAIRTRIAEMGNG